MPFSKWRLVAEYIQGVSMVSRDGHIFKVLKTRIGLVAVLVVALMQGRGRTNKGFRDESVNETINFPTVAERQRNTKIASTLNGGAKDASEAPLSADHVSLRDTNLSRLRNFVTSVCFGYGKPPGVFHEPIIRGSN